MRSADPVALGRAYRLCPQAHPRRGVAGQRFGKGVGSSLEFQEFRDYQAGDDLRHVDWRSYARTEQLHTRLYREEVAATFELLLDGSASMALSPDKEHATRQLASFFATAAAGDFSLRGLLAADPPRPLERDSLRQPELPGVSFDAAQALDVLPLAGLLRPGTVRLVLSDFLFPHDPARLVSSLGRGAGALVLLQVLDPEELDPSARGSLRLHEVESGGHRDLPVDDACVARYRDRLARLWQGLEAECARRGAWALRWTGEASLFDFVAGELVQAGLVEPR